MDGAHPAGPTGLSGVPRPDGYGGPLSGVTGGTRCEVPPHLLAPGLQAPRSNRPDVPGARGVGGEDAGQPMPPSPEAWGRGGTWADVHIHRPPGLSGWFTRKRLWSRHFQGSNSQSGMCVGMPVR